MVEADFGAILRTVWEPVGTLLGASGTLSGLFWGPIWRLVLQPCFEGGLGWQNRRIWDQKVCVFYVTVFKIWILRKSISGTIFGGFWDPCWLHVG